MPFRAGEGFPFPPNKQKIASTGPREDEAGIARAFHGGFDHVQGGVIIAGQRVDDEDAVAFRHPSRPETFSFS